jgi:hypothetical protein
LAIVVVVVVSLHLDHCEEVIKSAGEGIRSSFGPEGAFHLPKKAVSEPKEPSYQQLKPSHGRGASFGKVLQP